MIINGFSQLHNENEKGHLTNWLKSIESVCDFIYVYDQHSTDGSLEILRAHPKVRLIESPTNDFINEIACKRKLLRKLRFEEPETSWIFWMDGDTVLERAVDRAKLESIAEIGDKAGIDAFSFGHLNIYRSDVYQRRDSQFDYFDQAGLCCFWNNKKEIEFPNVKNALHQPQHPNGLKVIAPWVDTKLIHFATTTDMKLLKKFGHYIECGMEVHTVHRLIQENQLVVELVPDEMFPEFIKLENRTDPTTLPKFISLYYKEIYEILKKKFNETVASDYLMNAFDIDYKGEQDVLSSV